jgi:hypothetical protein
MYTLALVVNGVGNSSTYVIYYDESHDTGLYKQFTVDCSISFETGVLPAGSYNIKMMWKSEWDDPGDNALSLGHSGFKYNRTLLVQEIYRG